MDARVRQQVAIFMFNIANMKTWKVLKDTEYDAEPVETKEVVRGHTSSVDF